MIAASRIPLQSSNKIRRLGLNSSLASCPICPGFITSRTTKGRTSFFWTFPGISFRNCESSAIQNVCPFSELLLILPPRNRSNTLDQITEYRFISPSATDFPLPSEIKIFFPIDLSNSCCLLNHQPRLYFKQV
jgi:hypothetical protein